MPSTPSVASMPSCRIKGTPCASEQQMYELYHVGFGKKMDTGALASARGAQSWVV
ncbi:hypothetical protein IV72_GL001560 [Atopobium minutum]|nr:hypothetical protein HMPREF1247_1029 [Atopobium sp. BV3Ac4]KRN54123.1 hypothetical protein IV72_GL001560 [Atopobium minutum]